MIISSSIIVTLSQLPKVSFITYDIFVCPQATCEPTWWVLGVSFVKPKIKIKGLSARCSSSPLWRKGKGPRVDPESPGFGSFAQFPLPNFNIYAINKKQTISPLACWWPGLCMAIARRKQGKAGWHLGSSPQDRCSLRTSKAQYALGGQFIWEAEAGAWGPGLPGVPGT